MDSKMLCALFVAIAFASCAFCGVGAGRNIKDKEYAIAGGYVALMLLNAVLFLVSMFAGAIIQ